MEQNANPPKPLRYEIDRFGIAPRVSGSERRDRRDIEARASGLSVMAWIDEWAVIPLSNLAQGNRGPWPATCGQAQTLSPWSRHGGIRAVRRCSSLMSSRGRPKGPWCQSRASSGSASLSETGGHAPRHDASGRLPRHGTPAIVPEGFPSAMCIDDRPWDEARLTWSPAELIQRIHLWFRRAARGELHDPHQPVDPFFGLSPLRVVVPSSVLSRTDDVELVGFRTTDDDPNVIIVLPAGSMPKGASGARIPARGLHRPRSG